MQKSSELLSNPLGHKVERTSLTARDINTTPAGAGTNLDICRSPSWSDYRGDRRKKDNKKTEMDRKKRKEEEKTRAAELKAAKRMSKRPPAAMDTQRMPAALLRTSTSPGPWSQSQSRSASEDSSGRSSREGRRSSISSLVSFLGLSKEVRGSENDSTLLQPSPKQNSTPIRASAPKLGRLRGIERHSRKTSASTIGSNTSDSNDEYLKDIIGFAYQLQASQDHSNDVEVKEIKGVRLSLPAVQSSTADTPPPSRSDDNDSKFDATPNESTTNNVQRPIASRSGSSEEIHYTKQKNVGKDVRNESSINAIACATIARDNNGRLNAVERLDNSGELAAMANSLSNEPATRSSRDGSSYVRKQRLYQQQRSIAGYEDQLAIEMANRPNVQTSRIFPLGKPAVPPTPQDSAESLPKDEAPPVQMIANHTVPGRSSETGQMGRSEECSSESYHKFRSEEAWGGSAKKVKDSQGLSKIEKVFGANRSDMEITTSSTRMPSRDRTSKITTSSIAALTSRNSEPSPESIGKALSPERPSINSDRSRDKLNVQNIKVESPPVMGPLARPHSTQAAHVRSPSLPKFSTTPVIAPGRVSRMLEPFAGFSMIAPDRDMQPIIGSRTVEVATQPSTDQKATEPDQANPTSVEQTTSKPAAVSTSQPLSTVTEEVPPKPIEQRAPKPAGSIASNPMGQILPKATEKFPTKTAEQAIIQFVGKPSTDTVQLPTAASSLKPEVSSTSVEAKQAIKLTDTVEAEKPVAGIVGGNDGDGLIRKPALKRPRSDPELQVSTSDTPGPSFDFLPELKHQPLIKPKRASPSRVSFASTHTTIPESSGAASSTSPSITTRPSSLAVPPTPPLRSPLYLHGSSSFKGTPSAPVIRGVSPGSFPSPVTFPSRVDRTSLISPATLPLTAKPGASDDSIHVKPVAKMFVICCKCKYWHDLPSRLYEAMALPRKINLEDSVAPTTIRPRRASLDAAKTLWDVKAGLEHYWKGKSRAEREKEEKGKGKVVEGKMEGKGEGKMFTTVKCPWCEHGMSTACCAGWTTIVYMHERHH